MKSRDAVSRLKRFEVEEKQRKVAEIETMIGDFSQMAQDLDRQIAIEQSAQASRTPITMPIRPSPRRPSSGGTICWPLLPTSKPSFQRRATLAEAFEELKKIELSRSAMPSG